MDNVTQVIDKIEGDKWKVIGRGGVDIVSYHQLEEIQRRYSTDTEKSHACADYYVNYYPDVSWKHLTEQLYYEKEFAGARESKSFMSTGKYWHYISYWYNCYAH